MFQTILVAIDGSDHANRAADLACDLAIQFGARLVVIHVLMHGEPGALRRMIDAEHLLERTPLASPPAGLPGTTAAEAEVTLSVAKAVGHQIVERAEHRAREKGVADVHTVIEAGNTVRRILKCAEREGADLIVTGSRGLSDLKGLLLGSVSHKIGQLAKCPSIIVK